MFEPNWQIIRNYEYNLSSKPVRGFKVKYIRLECYTFVIILHLEVFSTHLCDREISTITTIECSLRR